MVGSSHEAMHRIFHYDSGMLVRTFRVLGLDVPVPGTVSVMSGDVTEIRPLERRIDTLLRCGSAEGEEYLVLVEAQRSCDPGKRYSWMYYLAYLADKYRVPVLLLVICQDRRVAEWAAQPVKRGVGEWAALTLRPLVVGPHNVPPIVDGESAGQDVLLAVFSVLTHANESGIDAILELLMSALKSMEDGQQAEDLAELTLVGLEDTSVGELWRSMMGLLEGAPRVDWVKRRGSFAWQRHTQKEVVDVVRMVRRTLELRGIALSDEQSALLLNATVFDLHDLDGLEVTLERVKLWFDRAVLATTAAEVFAD